MLQHAGFRLVDTADDETPGMRVSKIPSGVLVRWTALGGASEVCGTASSGRSTGSIVRTAVTAVLASHGLSIMSTDAAGDLIVLPSDHIHFHTP
ncbi:hypothetical protein [Streptomyces kanasensis]|uniref:hypothetical protein n=1 Tax=Streptomyces kanasensis TaxID=936756 RepID=UPI0036F8F95B